MDPFVTQSTVELPPFSTIVDGEPRVSIAWPTIRVATLERVPPG